MSVVEENEPALSQAPLDLSYRGASGNAFLPMPQALRVSEDTFRRSALEITLPRMIVETATSALSVVPLVVNSSKTGSISSPVVNKDVQEGKASVMDSPDNAIGLEIPKLGLARGPHSNVRGFEFSHLDFAPEGGKRGVAYFGAGLSGNYREIVAAAGYKAKNLPEGFDAGVIMDAKYNITKGSFQPPTLTVGGGYSGDVNVKGLDMRWRGGVQASINHHSGGFQTALTGRIVTQEAWSVGDRVKEVRPYAEARVDTHGDGSVAAGATAKAELGAAIFSFNAGLKHDFGPSQNSGSHMKVDPFLRVGLKLTF